MIRAVKRKERVDSIDGVADDGVIGKFNKFLNQNFYFALILFPRYDELACEFLNSGVGFPLFGIFRKLATFASLCLPRPLMGDIQSVMAWVFFAMIVLHVAAVLFHRLIPRDDVMQCMTG